MTTSRLQKYLRAIAPRPYEMSPEDRAEAYRVCLAVAGALTQDRTLLGFYQQEVREWLNIAPR